MLKEALRYGQSEEKKMHGVGNIFVGERGMKRVERDLGWLSRLTEFEGKSLEHLQMASELVEQDFYLVFYGNHTHHGNVGIFNDIVETLDPRPNDAYIAVSRRLSDEGQEEGLVRFSQNFEALRSPDGVHQVPFIVDRDLESLRELVKDGKMDKAILKQLVHETRENRDLLFKTLDDDAMFMVWPETTTEGGLFNKEKEKRNGMIKVSSQILPQLYEEAMRRGRRIAFIPVSVNGFSDVMEPRTRKVKPRAKLNIALSYLGQNNPLIRVNVGQPVTEAFFAKNGLVQINGGYLEVINPQDFTDTLMGEVAKGLDYELRGEYASFVIDSVGEEGVEPS